MERKRPKNGRGHVPLAISGVSGKSFSGAAQDARMRGPAQVAMKFFSFSEAAEFHRLQGEDVSLTGLFFQANPTAEMHGAS